MVKITRVESWRLDLKLQEPYAIAYGSYETAPNVFLRVATDGGVHGNGCAAPDPQVTGENAEDVQAALAGPIADRLKGADPLRPAHILVALRREFEGLPGALAAVDMALFDLMGKVAGLPVWRLLGGFRDCIETSITIGILAEDDTVLRARDRVAQGFRALKLKGGVDVEDDIARVLKVREAVGKAIELRFDANQGYTPAQAERFLAGVAPADLEILEQPTPGELPEQLGPLTHIATAAVMADESVVSRLDAFHLAGERLVDLLNVKVMKVGGIDEAMRVTAIGSAVGVRTMVGCMDEAALGIAAGLHFALARPSVTYADLDGHLDLIDDPTDGAVILRDGVLYPADAPGLGCRLD
jgi:L-alanine-DL-glutamate epimerase-like enolase superfamily enzyme